MQLFYITRVLLKGHILGIGWVHSENMWCSSETKSNWKSLREAKQKCNEIKECQMFFNQCGRGKFRYCRKGATIKFSSCASTLYRKGKLFEIEPFFPLL